MPSLSLEKRTLFISSAGICLLLIANYAFYPVSGGENQYLAMAKHFVNPTWVPNSFTLHEFPGTRVLFQTIFGWPLKFISIEQGAILFRVLNFIALSVPLLKIFRKFNLNYAVSLLVLQVFLTGQSQLGGEWMIGTFEPKTVAYVFFLWAFIFWHNRKYTDMVIFGVLACCFHVVVGGWFFLGVGVVSLLNGTWKTLLKPAILAVLLLLPLIIYISPLFLIGAEKSSPSADHIYAYIRLMNHLGIAKNWEYFCQFHLKGALFTLVIFMVSLFVRNIFQKPIRQWILACMGICLIYVIVAFIDSFWLGQEAKLGLKYYPFRLNSFGYFLFLLSIGIYLNKQVFVSKRVSKLIITGLVIALAGGKVIESFEKQKQLTHDMDQIPIDFIHQTPPESVFLLDLNDYNGRLYQNFIRLTGRENYSVYKFIPAEKGKLQEWQRRQEILRTIREYPDSALQIATEEGINYIISEKHYSGSFSCSFSKGRLKVYCLTNSNEATEE